MTQTRDSKGSEAPAQEISRKLKNAIPKAIARWEEQVRASLPAARRQDRLALLDELHAFLEKLAEALSPGAFPKKVPESKEIAKEHGEQRAELPGYSINQVLLEYDFLRKTIFEVLEADGPIAPRERNIILDLLAMAAAEAGATFVEKVEEKLRESESQFRQVIEQSPLSTQIFLPTGRTLQVNPAWMKLWDVSQELLEKFIMREYNILEDEQLVEKGIMPYVKRAFSGQAVTIPAVYYDPAVEGKPGRPAWTESYIYPVKDEQGRVREVVLVHNDVTDRKRIEEDRARLFAEEKAARRKLEGVAKKLHDLQLITEAALSRTTSLGDLLEESLEHIHKMLDGDTGSILLISEDRQNIEIRSARGLEDEGEKNIKIPIGKGVAGKVISTGEPILVDDVRQVEVDSHMLHQKNVRCLMAVPLRTKERIIGVLQIARLRDAPFQQDELQFFQLIADRLATAIDNANLFEQAQKNLGQLKEEQELRERFVAMVSHDLRGPLTAAKASADILLRYQEKGEQTQERTNITKRILGSIARADKMIQDLLDANRIRAGQRLPLQMFECDLHATAANTLDDLAMTHGDRFVLKDASPIIGFWSCEAIRRILENLATNAVKYGTPGTPITVTLYQNPDRVEIAVHNEGKPLTPEEQARLFEPFHRTHAAETSGKMGWGLGLTLVRGLTEAHGGSVRVESAEGKGTTFIVELPRDARPFQDNKNAK